MPNSNDDVQTLVVNFLAGPGAGKSTLAGSVFAELKWRGIDCELVTEYAKDKVWERSFDTLANQLYVLGKQSHRNFRLNGKVKVMVTDSSVLMSLLYSTEERHKSPEFIKVTIDEFKHYNNINFFIERNDIYVENGRYQTHEEALEIDNRILSIMDDNEIEYNRVPFDRESVLEIVDKILMEIDEE
ncbi:MAG: gp293 [uncultured marine phage]|uniref:Gp293 n=1 Tax=uncultured marine phage TaxID=707152 RepID=A0A8D9CDE4_9VIRU|nr:MAG: gp293 [uncultured marine phage]